VDKSRVLEVKPLRSFVPVFPNPPLSTPFVFISPNGPFPSGFQPFYPFLGSNTPPDFAIPAPIPLKNGGRKRASKMRTPTYAVPDGEDGHGESSIRDDHRDIYSAAGKRRARAKRKGGPVNPDIDSLINTYLSALDLDQLDESRNANGDKDTVASLLSAYNLIRRRMNQLEEANKISVRRPDLKTGTLLMSKGIRTNSVKRVGHVPGVQVGDVFFFRMELCLVGLHSPSMAGIDYMTVKATIGEEPIAVSIVASVGYDDNDDGDVLIYSGQGGVQRRDGTASDQKLERGNLALEKSLHRGNEVRVIRGVKDVPGSTGKVYIYDGVYKIQQSWAEKNAAGFKVFKYKLVRVPGQAEAFALWKSIQQWKEGTFSRAGVILPDLTLGAEPLPVALVNEVDGEKGPAHFTYTTRLKVSSDPEPSVGCCCPEGCEPGDADCACNLRNEGLLPYSSLGVLLSNRWLIYECGESCSCPPSCRGRISQAGLKLHLEVFKTDDNRGWGLRSWDAIRAGGFICEYAGEVVDGGKRTGNDDYEFDSRRVYDEASGKPSPPPFPVVISGKRWGNVARFMNHSCFPNVAWKPVLAEGWVLRVAFFAIGHIPPMVELTYDYGVLPPERREEERKKRKNCLCRSSECRGYFY
ncbi:hypothetical protein M569_01981, partial [Genlisea aurea]